MSDYQLIKSDSEEIQKSFSDKSSNRPDDCDDDFTSFKCYSPKEIQSLVISFNQIKSFYSLEEDIVSFFYSLSSLYQMQDDDVVGICPLQKPTLFISKSLKECENMAFAHEIEGDQLFSDEIVAKRVTFDLKDLPSNVVNESHFQFCYKNKNGNVIGLSIPFRLLKAGLNESVYMSMPSTSNDSGMKDTIGMAGDSMVCENQDDDDFIVVRSQESFLKERNEHLTNTTKLLEFLIRNLEKDVKDKMNEIENLSDQLQATKTDLDKELVTKQDALKNCDLLLSKNISLNESIDELRRQIESEQNLRNKLQNELDSSNKKLDEFENYKKQFSLTETEMKNILNDKEDQVSSLKDMVKNISSCNEDLNLKIASQDKSIDSLKSSLAGIMNERRVLLEKIEKLTPLSEAFKEENATLIKKIEDLELVKKKQTNEIASLEAELQNSISNFKNLNLKYQKERTNKEQQKALDMDKLKYEATEMRARLERSRIEYGDLYRKYQASQKKIEQIIKTEKYDNIYPALHAGNDNSPANNRKNSANKFPKSAQSDIDSFDVALMLLEKEEEHKELLRKKQQQSEQQKDAPLFANNRKMDAPLIDIHNIEQASGSAVNTSVKQLDEVPITCVRRPVPENRPTTTIDRNLVSIPCIMCDTVIQCSQHYDGTGQMHEMVDHLEQIHKQRMCPFCSTLFDTRLPIFSSYFQTHVQNHLEESRYPNNSAN